MVKIHIVDDEKGILDMLSVVFKKEGYHVALSLSAERALETMAQEEYDLLLSDVKLPGISGMELLEKSRQHKPEAPVIMMTAYGTIKQAVHALKSGAADYIIKPFDIEELKIIVQKALEKKNLREENALLKKQLDEKYNIENMIGKSRAMREISGLIEKIASTDSTLLITGESGTGKEIAAREVHRLSRRGRNRFVSLNCGALPESLLESELFGHVKGAFTGALCTKKGMFETAEDGTLFLDEVGEMSPLTQVKLLRTLQERKIRRVGGTDEIPVNARIIAATNQDLKKQIKEGLFREDLFYRLNIISVEMPPLRDRKEDIPILVSHFLEKHCRRMERDQKRITPEVMSLLEAFDWPGNVRELENVLERIVAIEERETITESCLPEEILNPTKKIDVNLAIQPGFSLNDALDGISKNYIQQALVATGGNLKETAFLLGLNYRSLRYLIEKFDLKNQKDENGKFNRADSKRMA